MKISVVIPVYNEEENIVTLTKKTVEALQKLNMAFEIIFINDGSIDNTEKSLAQVAAYDHRVKILNLRRNYG